MVNTFFKAVAITCLSGGLLLGCGKKDAEAEVAAPAEVPAEAAPEAAAPKAAAPRGGEVLPGASDVRAALAAGDYDRAVGGLLALQGTLTTDEQRNEYSALFQEVRDALTDASATNRKAAEAMMQLRGARMGR